MLLLQNSVKIGSTLFLPFWAKYYSYISRPLRITNANLPFHVFDQGNNHQKEMKFKLYHFCLVPNHIHFLIEPTIADSLPKVMMRLTLAYSSYSNRKYGGTGTSYCPNGYVQVGTYLWIYHGGGDRDYVRIKSYCCRSQ